MLSLMSVMSPPCLVQHIGVHGGEVMYFCSVFIRGGLGFQNCYDICMCVVNKQFELLEFMFDSVMLTSSMMRFLIFFTAEFVCCL